ncbi:hypothetical protein MRB53_008911 [Persea americana]|uniref:Uncharacterized protein n=1 Tax=Persea americana TaxID=3435 RepID=A0ACC2LMH9_PERAE|nr:hypothetical protein MRB53_008911 [Persea americana]
MSWSWSWPCKVSSHPSALFFLARKLSEWAPDVVFSFFCTPKTNGSLTSWPALPNLRIYDVADGLPVGHVSKGRVDDEIDFFLGVTPGNYREAVKRVDEMEKVSCVVSDAFLWFAREMAEEMSVAWVAFWIAGACALSDKARQQGDFESIHRNIMVGFSTWDFDPMDLSNPFPHKGFVHIWQGYKDKLVPFLLLHYVSKMLPWIQYHELADCGHLLIKSDGLNPNSISFLPPALHTIPTAPSPKAHVAVLTFPFGSHPSVPFFLTRKLAEWAADVAFSFFCIAKTNSYLSSWPTIPNLRIYDLADGVAEGHMLEVSLEDQIELFLWATPGNYREAIKRVNEIDKVGYVLSDALLWFAGHMAEEMGRGRSLGGVLERQCL